MAVRLAAVLACAIAERLAAGSYMASQVRVLAHQKMRTRAYKPPMHRIDMSSIFKHNMSGGNLHFMPDNTVLKEFGLSPTGNFMEHHAHEHSTERHLRKTHGHWAHKGHHTRAEPSSFVEEEGLHRHASLVHASQLETLRNHQREVASRSADEAAQHLAHASRSWMANAAGVIPLSNLRDSQYVGPVGVGTDRAGSPQSIISVVFDTGSTNLWISSTLCQSDLCTSREQYNPTESTSYADHVPKAHLDITFGTGELKGPQGVDSFHVGPYVVKNQTFALIEDEVGQVFTEIPFEGILGLAFPSMSAHGVQPFFDTVMQQEVLHGHNEISFFMAKHPKEQSAVFFGGVDERFFEGDITYFPVTQEHYWSVDVIDFKIGDKSHTEFIEFRHAGPRVSKLILDSGTTYFTAPPGLFQQVMDKLPSGNCKETASYPDLHYIMKDVDGIVHDVTVPPSVYMVSTYGDGWCDLSFMEIPVPDKYGPAFIFGEVFMRHWYTVFNRAMGKEGTATVGFAVAKHPDDQAQQSIKENNELTAWRKLAWDRSSHTRSESDEYYAASR
jgi:pepsin A